MALVVRRTSPSWPSFGLPVQWHRLFDLDEQDRWLPVEEFKDGDTFVVRAEIPDVDPEKDIEITTDSGVARIHARREQKTRQPEGSGYRSEFHYGEFTREIALPEGVEATDVTATYTNGILEVRIPNPEKVTKAPAKVPVTRT